MTSGPSIAMSQTRQPLAVEGVLLRNKHMLDLGHFLSVQLMVYLG